MKVILAFAILLAIASADQFVPISKKPYGFAFGAESGPLHIEGFLDLLCPDSRDSWLILRNVMKTIDFKARGITFWFEHVPLPYHFYSFKLHQAFIYIQQKTSENTTIHMIDYFFQHQDQFSEEVLMEYTVSQFLDELSALVSSVAKVDQKDLRKELDAFSDTDMLTRYHWKYSMEVHGIPGAPLFAANSVIVDGAEDYGFEEWIDFFKKYTD